MEHDKFLQNVTQIYLQHCRLGLAFAEDVVRRCCQTEITHLQVELRTAFEKNECIRETELDIRRMEGWDSSELRFQHFCHEKPACYDFLKRIADKLSTASKVNPYTLLMNISLQNCKDDDWEIAKLFLEPWMLECRGLEDLNAYCLLEMLGNLKIVNENDIAKTKEQTNITTLHKEHINKMRNIAETFFLTENEQITKEDKCIFLQAIINVLAFEPGPETDEVIQKIQEVMELEDSVTTSCISLPRLTGCTAKSIHALMYKTEKKDRVLRFQKNNWFLKMRTNGISSLYRLPPMGIFHPVFDDISIRKSKELDEPPAVKEPKHREEILYTRNEEERWDKTEISTVPLHDIIRDLLFYLEKNADPDDAKDTVRHIFKRALGECNSFPLYACTKIQELFERPKQHRQLKELLLNESESTNFKTYFLGLIIMESVLRPYIERKITLIHTEVRNKFVRTKLCDEADTNDICRADGESSDEVTFLHDCKKTPQCSKFLQCVLDKRSPKCKQKQFRMFKSVNPQDCLTNVWDFAKLFMDPWMHTNKGFEALDVFCLLTLLDNVQMFDANQSKAETLQQKVSKARYDAFNVLQMGTKTMKKHTMNERLHDLIYIQEEGILPVAYRAIQQLKDLIDNNKGHLFDIRLNREAKRQHCGQSLKKAGHGCWFKSIIALRHLNPVFADIVEDEINKLHEKTVNTFGPKPCPKATSDDICKSANNTAKFRHICPPGTSVACQKLLDIIKEHTAEKVSFCSMLKGTDPQIWLDSPFDYARIFLKKKSRWKRGFEDCDMTDLCAIVERCKPLINMFNNSLPKKIRNVHNLTMHAAEMEISQQEMEDNLDAILEFLQYIKSLKDTDDAAEAIDGITQLQAYDTRLLSRLISDLIDGKLPDTKMKHVEDKAKTLRQKIRYTKRDSERYCSLEERPDSPSPGCYDEETTAKKKGTTETLFSGDEDSSQPSTSSMRERNERGEHTRDEPTDRARGAKRVLQETGSEERLLMKKRKMAKKGRFETYFLGNVSIQPSTSSMRERSGRGEHTRDEPTDRARGAKRVLQETGSEERLLNRKRKMAEHIREMSEEQLKAILMKTVNKNPEVFEEITLI